MMIRSRPNHKRVTRIILIVLVLLVWGYFRVPLATHTGKVLHTVMDPVFVAGTHMSARIAHVFSFLPQNAADRQALADFRAHEEDVRLRELRVNEVMRNYEELMAQSGHESKGTRSIVASVVADNSHAPYDTMIVDVGSHTTSVGARVFATGDVLIGTVSDVRGSAASVSLLSQPGRETKVRIGEAGIMTTLTGRGDGNFWGIIPRDSSLAPGDTALLEGSIPLVVGVVGRVEDGVNVTERNVLVRAPLNLHSLVWVRIEE